MSDIEREAFEKWAELHIGWNDPNLQRDNDDPDIYIMDVTQYSWAAWQAARESHAIADPVPVVWINPINLKRTMIAAPGETVEVSAYREGEFTAPLYTHPPAKVPGDSQ